MSVAPLTIRPPSAALEDPGRLYRPAARIELVHLTAYYGKLVAVADVNLAIAPNQVTALIGPSGCGKATVLRCINALHQTAPGARAEGQILLDGVDILSRNTDRVELRRRVGMVFQRPNPFPTMSVYDSVTAGIRLGRHVRRRSVLDDAVEDALTQAHLWHEVRDRLDAPGLSLSASRNYSRNCATDTRSSSSRTTCHRPLGSPTSPPS